MEKIKIACIGDSITYGHGTANPDTQSYPAVLGQLLGESFEVRNFGVSATCALKSSDYPYVTTVAYTASLRYQPDIVILMLGTNDGKLGNFARHDRDFANDLSALIMAYQDLESHPYVFVATAPTAWIAENAWYHDFLILPGIVHTRIVPMQKDAAKALGCGLIDIHEQTAALGEYFPDTIHPNTEGYAILAELIYQGIKEYAGRILTERRPETVPLEHIEWCDYWLEAPDDSTKPRVLLIGDSISRAYRPFLMKEFAGTVLVDNIASSRGMDNPDYWKELAHLLTDERLSYDVIHFNNGLHAVHMNLKDYEERLEEVIRYLKAHSNAAIVMALSTPVYHADTGYDNPGNAQVIERNQKMLACAKKYGLAVNDLYDLSYGREEMRSADGVHYSANGSAVQAEAIAAAVRGLL